MAFWCTVWALVDPAKYAPGDHVMAASPLAHDLIKPAQLMGRLCYVLCFCGIL